MPGWKLKLEDMQEGWDFNEASGHFSTLKVVVYPLRDVETQRGVLSATSRSL